MALSTSTTSSGRNFFSISIDIGGGGAIVRRTMKSGGEKVEEILMVLLECGSQDLHILNDVGYSLGDIVEELVADGIKPKLNAITDEIFRRGQCELVAAVEDAIEERKDQQADTDDTEEGEAEYDRLQEEIDELESLDPEEDMEWFCNCIDTSCWFCNNEEIYRKYIPEAISNIEDNMGFEF